MIESRASCRLRALRLLHPVLSGLAHPQRQEDDEPCPIALRDKLLQLGDGDEQSILDKLVNQLIEDEPCPLKGLVELASAMVDFREGSPYCRDQAAYHHIARDLDKDLLIAARLAQDRAPGALSSLPVALAWPSVLSPAQFQMDVLLQRELVDAHVHLGGALPASFYWIALMAGFTQLGRSGSWGEMGPAWGSLLVESQQLRKELANQLFSRLDFDYREHLFDPPYSYDARVPIEPFVDYLLRRLLPTARERLDHNPAIGERWLLWQALHLIEYHNGREQAWFTPFLRYLRVRNSFIRHMGYHHGYRGLERYRANHSLRHDFSPRLDRLRKRDRRALACFERFRVRHALRYQFSDPTDAPWARQFGRTSSHGSASPWRPPRQLELRVSPWRGHDQLRLIYQYLCGFADFVRYDRDAPLLRLGIVFHLVRGTIHHSGTDLLVANGLESILRDLPKLRPFLVGVDVAGAEKLVRPRDYAPFFDRIRAIDRDQQAMPGMPPIRLRRTIHAGEDFDDQLTGLRAMDDALTLGQFEPGERIGHGLALFFDPQTWYRGRHQLHKRRIDHLLDLHWAQALFAEGSAVDGIERDAQRARHVRDLIEIDFSKRDPKHPDQGDPSELGQSIAKACRDRARDYWNWKKYPSEAELYAKLYPSGTPDTLMVVTADKAYIALVEALRERVIQRFSKREVVLEACPTSNMLISGLRGYDELPYTQLNRAGYADERDLAHPVLLTLNTDNPGNLGTTIGNEYRLVAQGMRERGDSMSDILRWLESVRQTGKAATFIPPWNPPTKVEFMDLFHNFFK